MIAVKSIEVVEVPRDILEYSPNHPMIAAFDPSSPDPHERVIKMIYGKRFFNARGEEFCIGLSEEVQEAIGLPFEIFDNMSKDLEDRRMEGIEQKNQINRYQAFISELGRAGFFKRLKYLFTGYKFEQKIKGEITNG